MTPTHHSKLLEAFQLLSESLNESGVVLSVAEQAQIKKISDKIQAGKHISNGDEQWFLAFTKKSERLSKTVSQARIKNGIALVSFLRTAGKPFHFPWGLTLRFRPDRKDVVISGGHKGEILYGVISQAGIWYSTRGFPVQVGGQIQFLAANPHAVVEQWLKLGFLCPFCATKCWKIGFEHSCPAIKAIFEPISEKSVDFQEFLGVYGLKATRKHEISCLSCGDSKKIVLLTGQFAPCEVCSGG